MKNRKSRGFFIRCKDCFWFDACEARAEQGVDPDKCTDFRYSELVIKKPNFWFYLVCSFALFCLAAFGAWLGVKFDNASAFLLTGAASVWASSLEFEYFAMLRDYHCYVREVQKDF